MTEYNPLNIPEWVVRCPSPVNRIVVRELPLRQLSAALSPLLNILGDTELEQGWNLSRTMIDHPEEVLQAVAVAVDQPYETIAEFPTSVVLRLLQSIVEANKSFFFVMHLMSRGKKAPAPLPKSFNN